MPMGISDDGPRKRRSRYRRGGESRIPKHLEREYADALLALNRLMRDQTRIITRMVAEGSSLELVQRHIAADLALANARYDAAARAIPGPIMRRLSDENRRKLSKSLERTLGVSTVAIIDTTVVGEIIETAIRDNTALIRTIPKEHFGKIEKAVLQNYRGEPFEEGSLAGRIRKIHSVTDNRARIIARDQTTKLWGNVNQARQEDIGVDSYIWRTSGDERVTGYPGGVNRPGGAHGDHYARDGKTYKWSDPPSDGHPGEAILCRCNAEPIVDTEKLIVRAQVLS